MGFALSRTIVYWGFDCAEDSIPFTRSIKKLFPYLWFGTLLPCIHANFSFHYHGPDPVPPNSKPAGGQPSRQPMAHMAWAQCQWNRYPRQSAHPMEFHPKYQVEGQDPRPRQFHAYHLESPTVSSIGRVHRRPGQRRSHCQDTCEN